eukprot:CAMPEP_0184012694 /NCGR_PEP_ID=MMETSP0954-20121128/4582_1 /TAXON_ID=627963 /ORGANISM="Aplanochytrium sp, Strain PBS07" /LENGTH=227 /DNA_ID=CAMNT_0026292765 /DNA_START=68 /DNA_END=752 /DNA_ORIENTATION=+
MNQKKKKGEKEDQLKVGDTVRVRLPSPTNEEVKVGTVVQVFNLKQQVQPQNVVKILVPSLPGEVYVHKSQCEPLDASSLQNLSTLSEGAFVVSQRMKEGKEASSSISPSQKAKIGKRKSAMPERKRILYSESNLAEAIITYLNKECKGEETQSRFGVPRQTVVMHCTKMCLKQKRQRTPEERNALKQQVNTYVEKQNDPVDQARKESKESNIFLTLKIRSGKLSLVI